MKKKSLKTDRGLRVLLDNLEGQGGEGEVYKARNAATGETLAVKLFADKFKTPDTIRRVRHLTSLNLQRYSPVLFGPIDTIVNGDVGHVSRWAEGVSLEEALTTPQFTLLEALGMCLAIAHGVGILHSKSMAYGDIQALNVKVHKDAGVFKVCLIDFDNYNCPGVPLPQMVGQHLYMAPELRDGSRTLPDIGTDNYELAVVFHEILLLRHPAAGCDDTEDKFLKAMCSGVWAQDRARDRRDASPLGGYPVTVLNPELENLFRRGLSLDIGTRPGPLEWKDTLAKALNAVDVCPNCGVQFIVDSGKMVCPLPTCRRSFPSLRLRFNGREVPLDSGAVVIGRADFGGAQKVSARHVVFHKIGPDTWMTAVGSNPTFRFASRGWIRLPNDKNLLVQSGDKLRLADVEVGIL